MAVYGRELTVHVLGSGNESAQYGGDTAVIP
jgi:hypothetical protein